MILTDAGDKYMVAPILQIGQRSRLVYLPNGTSWTHFFTNQSFRGGTTATVDAPLEHFPLFARDEKSIY